MPAAWRAIRVVESNTHDKRVRTMQVEVFYATVSTGWNTSALILEDNSGDTAPRKVTIHIRQPSDIAYLRERLDQIETAWQKALGQLKAPTV